MVTEMRRERLFTPEEYLLVERQAPEKSEFYDGRIYAMSGGSPTHALIPPNIVMALGSRLGDRPCRIFSSDLKVCTPTFDSFMYPDLSIVCGELRHFDSHRDVVANPLVVVEVLSPSTMDFDRGLKLLRYQSIPALEDYVVVYQDRPQVEIHHRHTEDHWDTTIYRGQEAVARLVALDCVLSLSEIYRLVEFESPAG